MMAKEGYDKIINFITPRVGVVVLGCGHFVDIKKMINFIK